MATRLVGMVGMFVLLLLCSSLGRLPVASAWVQPLQAWSSTSRVHLNRPFDRPRASTRIVEGRLNMAAPNAPFADATTRHDPVEVQSHYWEPPQRLLRFLAIVWLHVCAVALVPPVAAAVTPFTTLVTATTTSTATKSSTDQAVITDQIYLTIKGIPGRCGDGLQSHCHWLRLVSSTGLPAPCRPRAERVLQKEQLEANKVYNACLDRQDEGVSLVYSTIWRIVPTQRIDVGAVTGKYLAREYPTWSESSSTSESSHLRHDAPGIVSVRRGNDGGFGFTIYPGSGDSDTDQARRLDQDHIIVGRVVEGLSVVQALDTRVPVVASSGFNYMSLTGGPQTTTAPDRSCRYGGPMYCNENKPLVKLVVTDAGVIPSR